MAGTLLRAFRLLPRLADELLYRRHRLPLRPIVLRAKCPTPSRAPEPRRLSPALRRLNTEDLGGSSPQDHDPDVIPVSPAAFNPRPKATRSGLPPAAKVPRCIRPILASSRVTPEIESRRPEIGCRATLVPASGLRTPDFDLLRPAAALLCRALARPRADRSAAARCRSSRISSSRWRGDLPEQVHHAAGAGRNQPADDHVLLQALQRVDLAVDGGIGQHPGGLLEGGRRDERAGLQARPW